MEKRIVAGFLIVFAFISAFVEFLVLLIAASLEVPYFAREYYIYAFITLLLAILSFIGAYYAFTGKSWVLALAGSVFALLSIGILYTSTILGILALIIIALSRGEFRGKQSAVPQYQGDIYGGTLPGYHPPP